MGRQQTPLQVLQHSCSQFNIQTVSLCVSKLNVFCPKIHCPLDHLSVTADTQNAGDLSKGCGKAGNTLYPPKYNHKGSGCSLPFIETEAFKKQL